MTELEALRRVMVAARKWRDWQARSFLAEGEYALYSDVSAALLALDALPAPAAEPVAEAVEVAVWRDGSGFCVLTVAGSHDDKKGSGHMQRVGTTRLALVPEVVGEVG